MKTILKYTAPLIALAFSLPSLAMTASPSVILNDQITYINFEHTGQCGQANGFDLAWYYPNGDVGGSVCSVVYPFEFFGFDIGLRDNGNNSWTYLDVFPTGSPEFPFGHVYYLLADLDSNGDFISVNGGDCYGSDLTNYNTVLEHDLATCQLSGQTYYIYSDGSITGSMNLTGFDLTAQIASASSPVFNAMAWFALPIIGISLSLMFLSWIITITKTKKR